MVNIIEGKRQSIKIINGYSVNMTPLYACKKVFVIFPKKCELTNETLFFEFAYQIKLYHKLGIVGRPKFKRTLYHSKSAHTFWLLKEF